MSFLKVIVVLLVIGGAIAFAYVQFEQSTQNGASSIDQNVKLENFVTADDISWYQPENKDFNLALFEKPLVLNYTPDNAQSIEEQSFLAGYTLATNGSYFRGSSVEAEHAGLLQLNGEVIFTPVPDSQLTHVVVMDQDTSRLAFVAVNQLDLDDYASTNYSLFQTGPLIISDGQIQTELINKSLNGDSRALRTVLGVLEDGRKFLLVTRRNYTLAEIAEQILAFEVFKGQKMDVINLDGGASTAMYSQDLEQFNFMKSRRLPLVLGVL